MISIGQHGSFPTDRLCFRGKRVHEGVVGKDSIRGHRLFDRQRGIPQKGQRQENEETIPELLQELYARTKKPIVLILDEAQYLLSQETGEDLLFALKAARDGINLGAEIPQLMFVFTGSDLDKLSELIQKKTQAFYGAHLETFPYLGTEFIQSYTDRINSQQKYHKFDPTSIMEAFSILKYRPEALFNAAGRVLTRGMGTDLNRGLV